MLAGLSLGRIGPLLEEDLRWTPALAGGATVFDTLTLAARAERGVVTLREATLAGAAGSIVAEGEIDLPGDAVGLHLLLHPAVPDPPTIGLRLTGPWSALKRVPELAEATTWRVAHTPAAVSAVPSAQTP